MNEFWAHEKLVHEKLVVLYREGDENGDGVLTLDEFTSIVHNVDPDVSVSKISRMFHAALQVCTSIIACVIKTYIYVFM
jgi:hypothetical protein